MKAMVFAAGLGTRLRPFTLEHPKALVPVAGVPMLERVIERLKSSGITEIVVNVHHFAEQVTQFLAANSNFGISVHVSDESRLLLDTGGGILKARKWLAGGQEPFVVYNCDILSDFDLPAMIRRHEHAPHSLATLLVKERTTSRYLLLDSEMRMRGWTNVATGEVKPKDACVEDFAKFAFGGVHVISPEIFPLLHDFCHGEEKPFSIMDFYISACGSQRLQGYAPAEEYTWIDIGKPDSLAKAEAALSH